MQNQDLNDILKPYLGSAPAQSLPDAADTFNRTAEAAPKEVVSQGLAHSFRSEQTPPFSKMIGQMFRQGSGADRAGLLSHLIAAVGPGVLARLGLGSASASPASAQPGSGPSPAVSEEHASQLDPGKVEEIAAEAEKKDPGVIDRLSEFAAQRPNLVKGLGAVALTVALGQIAQRVGKR